MKLLNRIFTSISYNSIYHMDQDNTKYQFKVASFYK